MFPQLVKIITINTWKCDGEYYKRLEILLDQLKDLSPDIILCQETFASVDSDISTLDYLAGELSLFNLFTPARRKIRHFYGKVLDTFSGLGILSKFPINLLEDPELPTSLDDGGRNAQIAEIIVSENKKILVANIHLTFLKNNAQLRKQQLEFLASKISNYKGYLYKIIAGDFNCEIDAPELSEVKEKFKIEDCYSLGGGKEPRVSRVKLDSYHRTKCVDHILAFPVGTDKQIKVADSKVVLNKPDLETNIYPSDHFGISTTLILDGYGR